MPLRSLILTLGALGVVVLFVLLRPEASPAPKPQQDTPVSIGYRLVDGRVEGPAVTRVAQGTAIALTVRSDRADELHLHGYDLTRALAPGKAVTLYFEAATPGRFSLEAHERHQQLGVIEVLPR